MTFERDLFISFFGGFFAGLILFALQSKLLLYKKIILIISISMFYLTGALLLKILYNEYIPWRM